MKRSILWLLLTMFIAAYSIAYADTVQIGTGTSTTSYLPLYGLYGYNYTQQIYTQTQIGVSGNIEKIRFYYVSGTITNSKDWIIYMGHTTKTEFSSTTDWEPLANLNQVFAGDVSSLVPLANNWMEITLDTPFNYNNTDNLIIAVDENTSGWASMSWGAFSSASNTGIYYYSDSTNPDPASPPTASNRTGSINRVQLVFPSTSAPLAPTLGSPTNEATGIALDALLTWSSTPGAGDATSYDVYMDTVNGSTLVSNDQAGTSYSPTLAYSTTYHWKVVASNAIGDSPASEVWTFTTMADPTQPLPYSQDFNSGTSLSAIGWSGAMGIGSGHGNTSNVLYKNLWSSATTTNVVTPPIGPMAANAELMFDYRYVDYDSPYPGIELSAGDNLQIQVSTDNGATFTTIHTIDQSNHITSGSFATVVVELDAYSTGSIMLKFLANWGAGDYYLDIDNVIVRETPLLPIISVTPDSWDFGTQLINTVNAKEFTISNIGAGSLNVSSINVTGTGFALAEAFSPVSLLPLEIASFTVNFSPQTETTYSGNIAINDNRAVTNIPLIGAAIDATIYSGDLPHIENFDSVTIPDLPVGWTSIDNNADNDYWKTATGYANSGDKSASIYTDYNTANDDYLVTPPIELTGSQRLSFWTRARSTSEPEELSVVLSTTTPTSGAFTNVLMTSTPINFTTYTQYNIDLDDYNGICYIAFKRAADPADGYYLYIDDVKIDVILPEPPEPATLVWPLNGITTLMNPLLKWAPSATGEPATGYKVYMNDSGTFTETDLIYEGTATQFQTADMGYERTYYWKVLPINAHGSDPTCPTWSFLTPLENQLAEGFEATAFPPAGWQRTTSSTSYWGRSTTSPLEGAAGMYAYTSTSTVYTISSPMLTITSSSSLDFFAKVTDVTQKLQILESTDRVNWTQVGADITFATANVWNPISVNLSVIEPGNYYLAFSSPVQTTGYKYIYVDHIIGPNITPVVPGAPTLTAPTDAAEDQSNYPSFTWTAPTTGGVPSGYNIYMDTVDGSTLYASNVTSPYVPTTALDWEETYYWTVKAFNNAGTGDAPAARSFTVMSDPTIYTLPYTEGFENGNTNGSTSIANWSQAYVTGAKYWTANSTNTTYNRTPRTGSFNATLGWSASTWMFRPIELTGGVSYDMIAWARQDNADTDYASLTVAYGTEGNAAGMVNTIVPETGLTSGDYQMLSGSFTPATSGVYYIGILGTLPTSTNWYLSLDDITFRESPTGPPDPVTLNSPADEAENMPVDGFNLTWSPAVTGGTPTGYYVIMGSTADPDYMEYSWELGDVTNFDPTQAAENPVTFAYSETWYWTVMATNGDGDSEVPTPFSFTIMPDPRVLSLPYSQNFDGVPSSSMPEAWTGFVNSTSTYAYVRTTTSYPVSAPNSMYLTNSSDTSADLRLITPEILVPMNTIKLSFSARAGSVGPNLLVGTVDALDGTGTFNQIASIPLTAAHIVYTISFAEYLGTDQYICFKHGGGGTYRSIYIDNVYMEELVDTDMSVVSLTGMSYGFQNTPIAHTVTVKNNGTEPVSNYTVYLKSVTTRAILGQESFTDPLAADATNAVEFTWNPTSLGAMDIYGEVYVADDAEAGNNTTDPMAFNVYQEGILFEGFEGGVIPANWTVLNADGGTQVWQATTVNPRTGTYAARVRYETSTLDNDDWLITPPLQVTSSTTDNISFWMRSYSATDADPWQVLISTTDTNPASFTMIDEGDGMLANYVQKSYNLDSYGDAIIYLAVRYMGAYDWYLYVDEFVGPPVYEPASLDTPEVTISTVGSNVVLNWDAIPYATSYEVMAADAPEGPYTLATTVTAPTYSSAAASKKFYKVIAKAGATRSIVSPVLSLEQQLLQDEMDRAARSRQ